MSIIKTDYFAKSNGNGGGKGGGSVTNTKLVTRVTNSTEADKLSESHYIWGNEFDGTQDVKGDLLIDQNHKLTVKGDAEFDSFSNDDSYVHINSAEAMNVKGDVEIKNVDIDTTNSVVKMDSTETNNTVEISADNGITLHGSNSMHSNNINVDVIDSENADVITVEAPLKLNGGLDLTGQSLTVDTLYSKDITNDGEIKTQDLTVYGNAHFFNLVIDEVQHAGGSIILSAANFRVDAVQDGQRYNVGDNAMKNYHLTNGNEVAYKTKKLFQICYDPQTERVTDNKWMAGDYVFCHTFNLDSATTKHYWTVCVSVAHDVDAVVNGRPERCNMIEIIDDVEYLSGDMITTVPEGSCAVGDEIACLGSANPSRRDAILICAVKSFDPQVDAPCIVQYTNINSFSLHNKQYTYIGKNGNRFRGDFRTESGLSLYDFLTDGLDRTPYVHTAYANDDKGKDFTKNRDNIVNPQYIGFATDYNVGDEELTWKDYKWSRLFDTNGDEDNNGLLAVRERLYVNNRNDLYIDCAYSSATLKATDKINVYLYTLDGDSTKYSMTAVTQTDEGIDYYYLTQRVQENWVAKPISEQFIYARVVLTNANDVELDAHTFTVIWDAGAMFEVTDAIRARVSDCEGNISTLQETATSITARVQSLEAAGNPESPDSLYSRVGALEVRADGIDATVGGIRSDVNNVTGDLTDTRNQLSQLKMQVDNIDLSVSDKAIGGNNLLYQTNFGTDSTTEWYMDDDVVINAEGMTNNCGRLTFNGDGVPYQSGVEYIDVARQSMKGKLKTNTWYTISFYAANGSDFSTYVYPNVGDTTSTKFVDGSANSALSADCNHRWSNNTTEWTKHKMSFKTGVSFTNESDIYFLIRSWKNSYNYGLIDITELKLEEGQTATAWGQSDHDWESKISISANSISMNVKDELKNTGIDIATGKITLRGENTVIDGTLNVTNNGSGIIIADDDGTPRVNIRKQAIGSLYNIDRSGYGESSQNYSWENFQNEGKISRTFTFNIGSVESGQKIYFQTVEFDSAVCFDVTCTGTDIKSRQTVTRTPAMTWTLTVEAKVGTKVQYTKTLKKSIHSGNKFDFYKDWPWYVDPYFDVSDTGNCVVTVTVGQDSGDHLGAINYCIYSGLDVFGGIPITANISVLFGFRKVVGTLTKLGTDGLYMCGNEVNQYLYWGQNGFECVWNEGVSPCGIAAKGYNQPKMLYGSDGSGNAKGNVWGTIGGIVPQGYAGIVSGNGSTTEKNIPNVNNSDSRTCCRLNQEQSFVVCGGRAQNNKNFYVVLPTSVRNNNGGSCGVPCGMRYIIKDDVIGSSTIVTTDKTGKYIVPCNKHKTDAVATQQLPSCGISMYIYDGSGYWYQCYWS